MKLIIEKVNCRFKLSDTKCERDDGRQIRYCRQRI